MRSRFRRWRRWWRRRPGRLARRGPGSARGRTRDDGSPRRCAAQSRGSWIASGRADRAGLQDQRASRREIARFGVWSCPVVTATTPTPDKRIEPDDPAEVETTPEELAPLYRQMLAIRRMEEAAAKAYSQGKIGGFLHLIIGQEAVCVGAIAALEPEDYVVATYREHGHALSLIH